MPDPCEREGCPLTEGKVLEVEISNAGPKSYETAVALELPATWAEFNDALHMARIDDGHHCGNEVICTWSDELPPSVIDTDVDLYELQLFALRMTMLQPEQRSAFYSLLCVEAAKHDGPIPLPRLIDLTYNTDICVTFPRIYTDKALGAYLMEHGRLSQEETRQITLAERPERKELLLAAVGGLHRMEAGGVFTYWGYAEASGGCFREHYAPGETACFDHSGTPVVLQVSKSGAGLTAVLDLPAIPTAVERALKSVDAVSADECTFECMDCLIPACRAWINAAMAQVGSIGLVNDFAERLLGMELPEQIKYKALLEASRCSSLDDATQLLSELDSYEFHPEFATPWDYAETYLKERYPDLPPALFSPARPDVAGNEMMERSHATLTSYGLIRRMDGQPLPHFDQAPPMGTSALGQRCF